MIKSSPISAESSELILEQVLALAWSLWTELGVPGWVRRHQEWSIDPEPLILFTALVGERDLRLRDECISWCVRNSRHISIARLRNLLKAAPPVLRERWGPFAATINAFGAAGWPDATEPLPVKLSSKEGLDDFKRPAVVGLRLRTVFGVSARSEILLHFIAHPDVRVTAADLADVVHYSKRNVEKELEALRKAGMLDAEPRRNRLEHFVVQPESLLLFAAPRPAYFPRWDAIFAVLGALLEYEERTDSMGPTVAMVEARRLLEGLANEVRSGNLSAPPSTKASHALPTALLQWGSHLTEALAQADAKSLGWAGVEPAAPLDWRARSTEGVRGIVSPLLATATDLAVWADTRMAQERMPELIRRLILATADDLQRIDMASGEGVQQSGYDGVVVNAVSTPFVPAGRSVWEIGVSSEVKRKADSDYEKRSANPIGIDPAETTFVFVTPHRWASKRIWENARKQDGLWGDVRVLDADDLETWLSPAPAVHIWLSALLGKSRPAIQDLKSYWSDWCEATHPSLSAELVLVGREKPADDLRRRIDGTSTLVRVQSNSADEALACVAATVEGMEQADALFVRTLVVDDATGWNWAVNSTSPLILIPRFADPNVAYAIRHGNRVLIPIGREEGSPNDLDFPKLRRAAVKAALLSVGVAEERAEDLATSGSAGLTSLRRSLAIDKGLTRPAWAHRSEAPRLLPALLAGAWDAEKPGDQEVLSELAGMPYQDVERNLVGWANASDPPVRKVGSIWFLASKEDAWQLLSTQLTPTDLAQFRKVLLHTLGIPDPALDLPPRERWRAGFNSPEHPLSTHLRQGLVDTLAIMGARSGETTFLTGHTGQRHADSIVAELLNQANADESAKLWASLSGMLPLLAEAAPEPFLRAIEDALSCDPSPLLSLFTDTDSLATFLTSSPHTPLLWALEAVAWSPDYLGLVSQCLAALSRIDPRGTLSNRPSRSLRSVFLIWHPQTGASLTLRLAALDNLRRREPDIAWHLLLDIVPKRHDISLPSHTPRWRDWKDSQTEQTPFEEVREAMDEVVSRLLVDVSVDGKRWKDLLDILSDLPADRIVGALENTSPNAFSKEDRKLTWDALRSVISKYRSFVNADWALPAELVDRLEQVYERLTSHDPVQQIAWLFSPRPDLLSGERKAWTGYSQEVQRAQVGAIHTVWEYGGPSELLRLAHLAEKPEIVGRVLAQEAPLESEAAQTLLLDLLDADDRSERALAWGYTARRFDIGDWPWARSVLENVALIWSPRKRAEFLRTLRFEPETWDWATRFGEDTERAYWSGNLPLGINDPSGVERAIRSLLQYERPDQAAYLLGILPQVALPRIDPDLIANVLERFVYQGTSDQWGALIYDIAQLLDYLAASGAVEISHLARLEWLLLPLLRSLDRPPSALGRELAQNPSFFMDILCLVFRAHGEAPSETTDEQQARTLLGYQLLDSWRYPPGRRDDGTFDEEAMNAWVDEVRILAATSKREKIADQQIGQVLGHVPNDLDSIWPHGAVRNLVERIGSRDLETGLEIALHNSRGATWRGLSEGGAQERVLQTQYLDHAQHLNAHWPRTAAMLRRIARTYAAEARREDEQAELTEARMH